MATINLGSIKFNWQGAYNGATAYSVDSVVSYNGSSYICKLASTGNLPTNTTYWDQMSSAGTNGTNGTDLTTTLTTQGDIVYRDGSGLARLAAGTSGQVLQTGGAGANPSWGTVQSNVEILTSTTLDTTGVSAIQEDIDWATNTDIAYVKFVLYSVTGSNANNVVNFYLRNSSGNITNNYSFRGFATYRQEDGASNTLNNSNNTAFSSTLVELNPYSTSTSGYPFWAEVEVFRPDNNNMQFIKYKTWNRDNSASPYHAYYHKVGLNNDSSTKTGFRIEASNQNLRLGFYTCYAYKK